MAAVVHVLASPVPLGLHETMPLDTGVLELDQEFTADEMEEIGDAPKPVVTKPDDVYRAKLEEYLLHARDLVIDFSSLKTCLDPMGLAAVCTTTADKESTGTATEVCSCNYIYVHDIVMCTIIIIIVHSVYRPYKVP